MITLQYGPVAVLEEQEIRKIIARNARPGLKPPPGPRA